MLAIAPVLYYGLMDSIDVTIVQTHVANCLDTLTTSFRQAFAPVVDNIVAMKRQLLDAEAQDIILEYTRLELLTATKKRKHT